MLRLMFYCPTLLAVSLLVGCNSQVDPNRPEVAIVTGTVTYRQQPVEGAAVLFSPNESTGHAATGLTDAQGQYRLRTFAPGDGAVPGQYTVTVSKHDMSTANPDLEDDLAAELKNDASDVLIGPKSLLPERYSSNETSKLTATVSASQENTVPFDLVD